MILSDLVKISAEKLYDSGVETPLLDTQVLAASALGVDRMRIVIDDSIELEAADVKKIKRMITRREKGEPVAYITGSKEFYSLDFSVNRNVLIPRPETELLVDLSIYYAPFKGSFLDIGTGSGAVAVSVKHNRDDLSVTATDISGEALKVAGKNSKDILGRGKIKFICGDLFEPVMYSGFDLIVSNPPYVDPEKKGTLQRELDWEPEFALFSDRSGAYHVEEIISAAPHYLSEKGVLILEMDPQLENTVRQKGIESGFSVSIMNDYSSSARAAVLKRGV